MSTHLIAVYGSLRQGFGNHRIIQAYPMVATGKVEPYSMYDIAMGGFPAIVQTARPDQLDEVEVEVYEVDDEGLASVDRLEGHPNFYERHREYVKIRDGASNEDALCAWLYVQSPHQVNGAAYIPSGDWAQYKGVE